MTRIIWICGLAVLQVACGNKAAGTTDAGPDAGPSLGLTCGALLTCDQACSSDACTDGCYGRTTAVGEGLFDAFDNCLNVACPSTDGGPCAASNSLACSNCNESSATGACISELRGCESDSVVGPPALDGGAIEPAEDAGPVLSCGGLIACIAACPSDDGGCGVGCTTEATPEASALAGVLNDCLAMACPSVDGGPCATPGLACNGCIEQVELAEPDTCAAPYIACNADTSNAPDGGGVSTVLVDGGLLVEVVGGLDQAASTLVVGGDYLYFTQVISGSPVLRLWIGDGGNDAGAYAPIGPPLPTPVSLAVDANNVYAWSVGTFQGASSINNGDGTVVEIPLDGGAPITLEPNMEVLYDAAYLNAIAVDQHNVYFVAGANGNDGAIMRAAIGSGSAAPLYSGQYVPQALTTDGVNIYWADWGTFDAQGNANNDGSIWQGSVDGGTPLQLASGQAAPSAIAVDQSSVYWTNLGPLGGDNLPKSNSGSVMRVPIGGGTVTTLASGQAVPVAITVSAGQVYWTQYGLSAPGLIMSASVDGGSVIPLVAGLDDPAELVLAGNTMYWTNTNSSPTNGTIFSLSPF